LLVQEAEKMDFNYLRFLARVGASHIHPFEKRATDILIKELKLNQGQKALEIGCGTGGTMVKIASRYKVQLYGVDKLDEMLAAAETRIRLTGLSRRVCLFKGDIAALPFDSGTLDRAYAESVLGILSSEKIEAVLDEVYRVLGEGGIFVLNDAIWKAAVSPEQVQAINGACLADFGLLQASEAAWSLEDWKEIFQRHGFRVRSFLIEDYIETATNAMQGGMNWREMVSEGVTRGYKMMAYLNRGLFAEKRKYDALLERHRDDGRYIESRIFVLTKE
jgi:ubiquinone/menaquinone biosynthesis C-methylase UbiE